MSDLVTTSDADDPRPQVTPVDLQFRVMSQALTTQTDSMRRVVPVTAGFKMPRFVVPKIDLPKIDLPKIDLPKIDLPKIDVPKIDVPKIDTAFARIAGLEGARITKLIQSSSQLSSITKSASKAFEGFKILNYATLAVSLATTLRQIERCGRVHAPSSRNLRRRGKRKWRRFSTVSQMGYEVACHLKGLSRQNVREVRRAFEHIAVQFAFWHWQVQPVIGEVASPFRHRVDHDPLRPRGPNTADGLQPIRLREALVPL